MKTKFKVGDKVRLVDTETINADQRAYIGKKGVVEETSSFPFVKFKDGARIVCDESELKSAKKSRHPFDLERALAGEEVVTRDGRKVAGFIKDTRLEKYPYKATIGKNTTTFTEQGRQYHTVKSAIDLFMKHPATNSISEGLDQVKEALRVDEPTVSDPELQNKYNLLLETFENVVNRLAKRVVADDSEPEYDHYKIVCNWRRNAGLPI